MNNIRHPEDKSYVIQNMTEMKTVISDKNNDIAYTITYTEIDNDDETVTYNVTVTDSDGTQKYSHEFDTKDEALKEFKHKVEMYSAFVQTCRSDLDDINLYKEKINYREITCPRCGTCRYHVVDGDCIRCQNPDNFRFFTDQSVYDRIDAEYPRPIVSAYYVCDNFIQE